MTGKERRPRETKVFQVNRFGLSTLGGRPRIAMDVETFGRGRAILDFDAAELKVVVDAALAAFKRGIGGDAPDDGNGVREPK
jgi:hypothetical protein